MEGFLKPALVHISHGHLRECEINTIFKTFGVRGYVKRRNFLIVDKSHLKDVEREVKAINEKYWDEERAKNINFVKYTLELAYAKKILEKGGEQDVDYCTCNK